MVALPQFTRAATMRSPSSKPTFRRSRMAPLLAVLSGTLGCGACNQLTSTSVGTIGANGGTLHSDDCGFTLVIPPGALSQDVPFVLQTVASPDLPQITGRVRISEDCGVVPVVPLAKPAKVTLTYDPKKIPATVSEQDADMRVATSNHKQVRLQDLQVDTAAHQVTATTTATGDFFDTAPQGPQPAGIELTPAAPVALEPGATQQYSAVVRDDTGQPDPVPVAWSVDVARVASIDDGGLLTAIEPGIATVTATAGEATAAVQVYVISTQPSPPGFDWENPRPQGNDIHGLSFVEGQLLIAADNGTVLAQLPDGGFDRLLSSRGLDLAGAAEGGGRAGAAGTLDIVQQGVELIAGVLVPLEPGQAPQSVAATDLSARAVYGDDAGIIAVGAGNDAFLLRNGDPADAGWVALETPVSEALLTVDADPTGGRRVVGARGQVYRQDDLDWFPIWDQPLGTLFSFAVVDGHDAYGIDAANALRHFVEGQGWQPDSTPPGVTLDHVSLLGRLNESLALAGADTALAPHLWLREGATWSEVPGVAPRDELFAAAADGEAAYVGGSNGALYAVGDGGLSPLRKGLVEDVSALAVADDGSAYAVTSNGCADSVCAEPSGHLLVRGADGSWQSAYEAAGSLYAVAARSAGDVFFGGDFGFAWHFDGTTATPLTTSATGAIRAMRVCGGDVWMASDDGTVAKFDGASTFVTKGSLGTAAWALDCSSASDVWVAGDYAVEHYDGSTWSSPNREVNDQPWRAIAATSDEVWVTGETGYLLHGDRVANHWEAVQNPAGLQLHGGYGLWQSGPGDLYLVGSQQRPREAVLLRYNGATWTALDPGTDHELFAVAGNAPGQFFIGGRGGAVLKAEP